MKESKKISSKNDTKVIAKSTKTKKYEVTCIEKHEVSYVVTATSPELAIKKAKLGESDDVIFLDSEAIGEVIPGSYACMGEFKA